MNDLGQEPRSSSGAFTAHDGDHPLTIGGIVKVLGLVTLVGGLVAQAAVGHYRIGELERSRDELKAEVKEMREERTRGAVDVPLLKAEVAGLRVELALFRAEVKESMRELKVGVRNARGDGR